MEKPQFLTATRFDAFDLPEQVLNGLNDNNLTFCTPIQALTLPLSLKGQDVAGQAQTGTGKTAAFLVTIFSRLVSLPSAKTKNPLALIVAPTRELALQIFNEAKRIGQYTGFALVNIVGGVDYDKQSNILRKGVDIVIGTPGRIIDFYKQGILKTDDIRIVVIDEADRLLDLGFAKDMRYILRKLPHYEKRQSMLFSATLSYRVMELTYEYMNLPEFISVTPEEVTVDGVEQSLFHVGMENKLSLLLGILTKEDWERMIIFVNTKIGVEYLTKKLKGNGWPAEGITGDLHQRKRFKLMEKFKSGKLKILIATDVASRGIHVEDVSHVINYDLPQDAENYIHRIGRTARAGKKGKALSLACEKYVFHLEALEDILGYKLPVIWPEDNWFMQDKAPAESASSKVRKAEARKRLNRRMNKENRKAPPVKKRPPGEVPGSFFGFKPVTDQQTKSGDKKQEKNTPGKKRRYRRKKKNEPASKESSA